MPSTENTSRMQWHAVAIGAIADHVGSTVMAFIVAYITGLLSMIRTGGLSQRVPETEASGQAVYEFLSIVFVVVGGLVAARIARTRMILHGLATSAASLVVAHILAAFIGADFGSPGRALFFAMLTLAAGPLGGAIATLFGQSKPKPAAPAFVAAAPAPVRTPAAAPAHVPGQWVDLRDARNQPPRY